MSSGTEVEFSVEDFLTGLEKLMGETTGVIINTPIFKNTIKNEIESSDKAHFFKEVYPKFEELYYTVRAKGIMKKYIKD